MYFLSGFKQHNKIYVNYNNLNFSSNKSEKIASKIENKTQ
jgi:hypothetical protein